MRITKDKIKQIIIEELDKELALLNEQSIFNKIVYAPARALSAIERKIREKTGIRGVLDPSVIYDADGKLIIPPPSKLKQWQKDYPGWYAAAQAFSNQTAGDPVGLIATALGGGVAAKGARRAIKGLKSVKPAKLTKANVTTKAASTSPKTAANKLSQLKAKKTAEIDRLKDYVGKSSEEIMLDQAKIMRAKGMTKQADEIEKVVKTGMEKTAAIRAQTAKSAANHKRLMTRMQKGLEDFKAGRINREAFKDQIRELGQAIIDHPASTPQTKEFIKNYVASFVNE